MSKRNISHLKKPLTLPPGYWQLFSYGVPTEQPTVKQAISIHAFFRKVELNNYKQIIHWHDEIQEEPIPLGELIAWDVGCIFNTSLSTVYPAQPLHKTTVSKEFYVEFSNENCSFLRRFAKSENGNYFINNSRLLPEKNYQDANIFFLCTQTERDTPLLIPCTTVLSTFWGRSSSLLHMLLDSRFLEFDRYVVNTQRSYIDYVSRPTIG